MQGLFRNALRVGSVAIALLGVGCGSSSGVDDRAETHDDDSADDAADDAAGPNDAIDGDDVAGPDDAAPGLSPDSLPLITGEPIYTRFMRLTNVQWEHAVTDILRLSAAPGLASGLPDVVRISEFDNNEKLLYVGDAEFLAFETAAETLATLATATPEALQSLYSGTDAAGFVAALGRRAFRRPLTAEEQTRYEAVFAEGESIYGPGFANGAALVIRAMLQSPKFLYRSELGPEGEPLSGYELASKLSFWLLGTTPSDALLDTAAAGELDTVEGVVSAAQQMLESPDVLRVMRDFHGQLYHVDWFLQANAAPAVTAEFVEVSQLFFESVFKQGEGLRQILTSTRAYTGAGLAQYYAVDPAPGAGEFVEFQVQRPRQGYFMQVPFLLLNSLGERPDPIHRGLALMTNVLCAQLPPEVAAVPPPVPETSPDQTNRQWFESVTEDCGDCHKKYIDPLGFAFEAFDGRGQPRELDNGQPIDTAGSFPFVDGTQQFADAGELMEIMADGSQAHTCYAHKLSGYALQRDISPDDNALLESLATVSRADGSIKQLVLALAAEPAFRLRAGGVQ